MPKAELHVHLEGTLSPAQRLELAQRNELLDFPYQTVAQIEAAQSYSGASASEVLQQFLAFYFQSLTVLQTEQDFYDATYAFLQTCQQENTVYVELSFDPQAHTTRGLAFETVIEGIDAGRQAAQQQLDVECHLIMCINRDRSLESAEQMLVQARPYRDRIIGLGLDSAEEGNPPIKFETSYRQAQDQGYRLTAHCDVDQRNSVQHIWQCIDTLRVERIDHGINAIEDEHLVDVLKQRNITLTACPTWRSIDRQPRRLDRIRHMLELGLQVTLNSDDPGLFPSRTLNTMLPAVADAGAFQAADMVDFMANAFRGAWLTTEQRSNYLNRLRDYANQHGIATKL